MKSGLFTSGDASITLGMRQETSKLQGQSSFAAASTVGSSQGDVVIQAAKRVSQVGSDVLAPQGNISIQAQTVDIVVAEARSQSEHTTEFIQGGITLAVSSPVISAIQTVQQMKALAAGTAALAAKNAADAIAANPSQAGGASIQLSIGASQSQAVQTATTAQGSTVAAGGNIDIAARGAGADSDLTIQGSTVSAGHNVTLYADDAINLLAAKNTADQKSKNSGASASIGISLGSQTGITVAASGSRGKADGSDVNWSNTQVEAGNALTLQSGGDTTMKGAVASGKQVIATIGGNLTIESLQDTSKYDSKQQSIGGSVTIGPAPGASISASQSKINSDYASVIEQSGIKAGDDGFQVTVNGNTDLKGAVIASSEQAVADGKNSLTTGTLATSEIQNRADYSAKATGISVGVGSQLGASAGSGKDSDKQSSTTHSGISGGTLTLTDAAGQFALTGQDAATAVASLNRDVASDQDTANALTPSFDANKVQQEINAQVAITQAFSKEAPKAIASYANTQVKRLNDEARVEPDAQKKQDLEAEAKKWDEGDIYRVALHTASGAFGGGISGALAAGAVASAAPLLNELQAQAQAMLEEQGMTPKTAKLVAQGLGQLTAAGIGAAAGGAQGAAAGLTVDTNNRQLHWDTFEAKREACRNSSSAECKVINRMAGTQSQPIDFLAQGQTQTVANLDASCHVVSYTVLDASHGNQPIMIMEPAEYQVYRQMDLATQGMYLLAPQWSLDQGSAFTYLTIGNTDRAKEHLGYVYTSPEFWMRMAAGATGGTVLGRSAALEGAAAKSGIGKVVGNFSTIKPGPLADNLAGTFGGGRYTTVMLQNDTILYRAGTADQPPGQFFSLEPPTGVLQTRIDKAVLPECPGGGTSPIDTSFSVKIPAGTQVHIGEVGTQSGFYIGGTQQVVVPKPWTIPGVQVINSSPLK